MQCSLQTGLLKRKLHLLPVHRANLTDRCDSKSQNRTISFLRKKKTIVLVGLCQLGYLPNSCATLIIFATLFFCLTCVFTNSTRTNTLNSFKKSCRLVYKRETYSPVDVGSLMTSFCHGLQEHLVWKTTITCSKGRRSGVAFVIMVNRRSVVKLNS